MKNIVINELINRNSIQQYLANREYTKSLEEEIEHYKLVLAILCSYAPNQELRISDRDLKCMQGLRYVELEFKEDKIDKLLIIKLIEK